MPPSTKSRETLWKTIDTILHQCPFTKYLDRARILWRRAGLRWEGTMFAHGVREGVDAGDEMGDVK